MTMTKAALRTTREALGLTTDIIAEKAGRHRNIIVRAESPSYTATVSPQVERAVRELAADFDAAADRIAKLARKDGLLERPADRAGFDLLVPELADWPDRSVGLFMAEVLRRSGTDISYPKE